MASTARTSLARLYVQWMLFVTSTVLVVCVTIAILAFPPAGWRLSNVTDPFTGLLFILSAAICILSVVSLFGNRFLPGSILRSIPITVLLRGADSLLLLGASIYTFQLQVKTLKADPIGWWNTPLHITVVVLMTVGLPLLSIFSLAKCFLICEAIYSRPRSATWISVLRNWNLASPARNALADTDDRRKDSSIFGTRGVEPRALGLSRGALALVLCGILIGRGFTDLVVGGIREVGATTVKSVYVQSVDPFPNSRIPAPMWSIQVELFEAAFQSHAVLGHAVNVTPLWDVKRLSRHPDISTTNLPLCQYVSESTIVELDAVRVATFFCPDLSGRNNRTVADWLAEPYTFNSPTLFVTIDYDMLNISRSPFSIETNTVNVALATVNDTRMVRRVSRFMPVVSGTHSLATVRYRVRSFAKADVIALGIFTSYKHFLSTELYHIGVDPFAIVNSNDNTASLRIFAGHDPMDWIFNQDDRRYSILNALSTLGGMWTSFNSIFVLIFGGSMLVLLGFKPVSAFGLAHKFSTTKIRGSLRRQVNYREGYPISENAPAALAFMDRFLVDFDMLGSEPAAGLEALPLVEQDRAFEIQDTPGAEHRSQLSVDEPEAGVDEAAQPQEVHAQPLNAHSGLDPQPDSVVGAA